MYSNGLSEEIIGKAIKQYNIPRHRVVVMTKCWNLMNENDRSMIMASPKHYQSKDFVNQFGKQQQLFLFRWVDYPLQLITDETTTTTTRQAYQDMRSSPQSTRR